MRLQLVIDHNCISPKSEEETLVESPFLFGFFSRIWLAITAHNKKGCRSPHNNKKIKTPKSSPSQNEITQTQLPLHNIHTTHHFQKKAKMLLKLDTKSPILNTTISTFFFFFFFFFLLISSYNKRENFNFNETIDQNQNKIHIYISRVYYNKKASKRAWKEFY
jgi:hypothetical protein